MRHLNRLPEPQVLIDKKILWRDNFLASGKDRPDSSKYAHKDIRNDLNSTSHHKCFYCETKFKGLPREVDHLIEVTVDKRLSFEWDNLYLSCDNCNGKIRHDKMPINICLNPFNDTDEDIFEHISFDKELIIPKNNSEIGLRTIQKYRLDSDLLDNRRLKQITSFQDVLLNIKDNQINENRNYLTPEERELINSFKRADNPYTLMFKVLLTKYGF